MARLHLCCIWLLRPRWCLLPAMVVARVWQVVEGRVLLVSVLLVRHWLLHAHDLCAATARQTVVASVCVCVCASLSLSLSLCVCVCGAVQRVLHAQDLCAATARQAFVGSMCERVCVCVVQCSERSKEDALCGTGCCWTCRCGGTGAGICGTPAGMLAVCI